ncbi:hypothetical protein KBC31_02160 [Candidatus Saccharibacteria bacterium]|jgi:hypothetical protein|nr:hypothetical protein [Candidatus Saccharibacteria bacterium]
MIEINEKLLKSLGIELNGDETAEMLKHITDTLNERVGLEIAEQLTDEELAELMAIESDEDKAAWLQENLPEYIDIIEDEADILLGELAESSIELAETSQEESDVEEDHN